MRDSEYEVRDGVYSPARLDELIPRAKDLFARMRGYGMESIHEGKPLEQDEQRYREMKGLPAYRLENAAWRVDVVPGLSARVVSMVDKSTGRDALRRSPPGEGSYPGVGGQVVSVHDDYYAKAWDVNWVVDSQTRQSLVLIGQGDNGVRIVRTLELTARGLHAVTVAENKGATGIATAIQVRAEFSPGAIDGAGMSFVRTTGERVEKPFLLSGEQPTGKETWMGAERPAGEWRLRRADGETIVARFEDAQVERSFLNWTAKSRPGVSFGLWSAERMLAPGQSLRLEVDYGRGQR